MWTDIEAFILVTRCGSFQAAAKQIEVSAVTLGRRIDRLEQSMDAVLLLRGKAGIEPTAQGKEFLRLVTPVGEQVAQTVSYAKNLITRTQSNRIRISATEPVITEILAPNIGAFLDDKDITVELRVENKPVKLSSYEADIALRFIKPEGNSLRVKRLATFKLGLWHHKDYDTAPNALRCVGYDDTYGEIPERIWLRDMGLEDRVEIRTSSTLATLRIICAQGGVGVLPEIIANRHPDLVRMPVRLPIPDRPLWLMMHPDIARQKEVQDTSLWLSQLFKVN